MPYSAEISRANPSCFLFVIDQSGSMADPWGPEVELAKTKADKLAEIINRQLMDLTLRSTRAEGVRDHFHVGVLGYGATVGPAFAGSIAGRDLVPLSEVADNPARIEERVKKVEDGAGGLVDETVKFPVWFEATANGGTPMCNAMSEAKRILNSWLSDPDHKDCFPPVLIHITDGESTDGDPTSIMNEIKNLSSTDGNVVLFNLHLSSNPEDKKIEYPTSSEDLPNQYAQMLFETADFLTPNMLKFSSEEYGLSLSDNAKAYVLNGEAEEIIRGLDIGTRPGDLR